MVAFQLGLSEIPDPSDAADALAVAICHLHEMRLSNLLMKSEESNMPPIAPDNTRTKTGLKEKVVEERVKPSDIVIPAKLVPYLIRERESTPPSHQ